MLKEAHFHHKLDLSVAYYLYPQLTNEILSSLENCQVLCEPCHVDLHNNDSLALYTAIAANLLKILDNWSPPKKPYNTQCKNPAKRARREKQNEQKLRQLHG